jgi:SsrA-binding protein
MKIISQNKKARFDYEVLDTIEAGIVLIGDEVKALRAGHINLTGSFAVITAGELFLLNCHITPYDKAFEKNEDAASRTRKLLVHRKELTKLIGEVSQKGITLVPLKIYFNARSKVKLQIGLCKHKKVAGKKKALQERDIKRETAREVKDSYKYR